MDAGIQAMPVLSEAEGDGNLMVMSKPDLTAAQAYRLPSWTLDLGIHAEMTGFEHLCSTTSACMGKSTIYAPSTCLVGVRACPKGS